MQQTIEPCPFCSQVVDISVQGLCNHCGYKRAEPDGPPPQELELQYLRQSLGEITDLMNRFVTNNPAAHPHPALLSMLARATDVLTRGADAGPYTPVSVS